MSYPVRGNIYPRFSVMSWLRPSARRCTLVLRSAGPPSGGLDKQVKFHRRCRTARCCSFRSCVARDCTSGSYPARLGPKSNAPDRGLVPPEDMLPVPPIQPTTCRSGQDVGVFRCVLRVLIYSLFSARSPGKYKTSAGQAMAFSAGCCAEQGTHDTSLTDLHVRRFP